MRTMFSILLFFFLAVSCDKNQGNSTQISGHVVGNPPCKNALKSENLPPTVSDTLSCIEYSYNADRETLTLTHINASFNCCPDSLLCSVELLGNTIVVDEFNKTASCRCNCLYDLTIDIFGVRANSYKLKIVEPYIEDQEELVFNIDIAKEPAGSFCVERNYYPWAESGKTIE